jgi:hypothetical protein
MAINYIVINNCLNAMRNSLKFVKLSHIRSEEACVYGLKDAREIAQKFTAATTDNKLESLLIIIIEFSLIQTIAVTI